jgi:type IV secretory pathway VirB2 component (pilin)
MNTATLKQNLKTAAAAAWCALAALPLHAQLSGSDEAIPSNMKSMAEKIQAAMTSPFIKTILIIMLCASAIAYAFNKDNEKIKRNCIVIAIAAGILISASTLVNLMVGDK